MDEKNNLEINNDLKEALNLNLDDIKEEDKPLEPNPVQPVIIKQFDIDEALKNPLVQNLITAGASFLNTTAEKNKIMEVTQQERVKSQVDLHKLTNEDRAHERKFKLIQDIINRLYNIIIFIGLCGLFLLLWKLEILDKSAVQLLIPLFAVLVASGTDFKSMVGRNKRPKNTP